MPRRRPRFVKSNAGTRGGRQFFWFRFTPFSLTLQEAATATHADIILTQSDWQNPTAAINETQRGGPRLERYIVQFGLAIDALSNFYSAGSSANMALIPEFMMWKQSDAFATTVVSSTTFDSVRNSNRVLLDEVPNGAREFAEYDSLVNDRSIRSVQGQYESKSKVRLADGAIGFAWRGLFDTGTANLAGFTDWVRPTLLISVP